MLARSDSDEYEYSVGWKQPTLAAALWVLALGAWVAAAVGLVGGPWAAVSGSVLTVLAGVFTAYIPSFRDEARRAAEGREQAGKTLEGRLERLSGSMQESARLVAEVSAELRAGAAYPD